ncbi:hypothetical protein BFF94_023850 [Burkholderia catarinensis]|nr:hypothetical protein BFF94_023850 [Burkholderia catarinensis]
MGACPTDTDLFHEPGENGGDQTCYYNGFSRPSFGGPSLYSRWQQDGACAGESGRTARFQAACGLPASCPDDCQPGLPGRWS